MPNDLINLDQHDVGSAIRNPFEVLEEAKQAAKALRDVVSQKTKPVVFNGEQYLEFEDLQTLGRFYGITAKVISTEFINYGEVQGFEAHVVAMRSDGMEISAADSMCLNDEQNWKSKPLFQLRSMAQTRACAKCLRNVLAWVVVLAGYKPTPAEEMQGVFKDKPPLKEPGKKTEIKDPSAPATEPQIKAIYTMLGKSGIEDDLEKHEKVSIILKKDEVITSFTLLTKGEASQVIDALSKEKP